LTVKTTSSVFVQPALSVTVKRKVAVAGALVTCTVAGKVVQFVQDAGETKAAPFVAETILQDMLEMELMFGCATPLS